ncbi:MAG: hypothetical protein CVV57_05575 [Tenericutes bacterium HGW-Tenericutes-2]|jgi:hypothetical protein|nr:MAG: hypothetical protein CVV57_05575 [Tenericutes bacterium HGW-Tenericutes-2]
MKYFVVFQNKTFKEEHQSGILWAPKKDINGRFTQFHWESMTKIRKGDVVFSIISNYIVARSIAKSEAIDHSNPFNNELWSRDGWLVYLDYDFSIEKIKISEHIDEIRDLLPDTYSPFNKVTGGGNQGYLFPISKDLGRKLDEYILDVYEADDLETVFTIDEETSDIIRQLYEEQGIEEGQVILAETERPNGSNKPRVKKQVIHGRKIDFIEKAKKDAKTGVLAEELVVAYEKEYLIKHNKEDLANRVKWVANEADGFGYDVLSYSLDGKEKYIEVKATILGKSQSFDISANEIETSRNKKNNYWIYRVYYMNSDEPKFFKINGDIEEHFYLEPTSYKAYLKEKKLDE